MSQTHELIRAEVTKLNQSLCKEVKASDDGKKFSLLMLKKLSGYKKRDLKKYYTDGPKDHQIDGIYFVEGDQLQINILSCCFRSNGKCVEDKDVTDLIYKGLNSLFFGKDGDGLNEKLKKIKAEIQDRCKEYNQKFIIVVKFICTSDEVLSETGESDFLSYQIELQSKNIDIEFEKMNDKQVSALLSSRVVLNTPMPIKLSGRSYYQLVGREGFVCRLPVKELIYIYFGFTDDKKKFPGYGDFLFEDNVRKNLGLERKINQNIYISATDPNKAVDFEYFNNGLTVIYDESTGGLTGDSPVLCIKGLQVVNGCQTINTLIRAHEDKKLSDDIYVTCRFIKRSDDREFIQSVITYTNSQNEISDRDLHANDRIQYDLQGILRNINIQYERKLNEFREEEDDLRLDAMDAAQAYLCCELQEPHTAKQCKRKLFNELYHKIFDDSKIGLAYKLMISYKVLDYVLERQLEVRKKKRKTRKLGKRPRYSLEDLVIAHGTYHIAAILYEKLFLCLSTQQIEKQAKAFKFPMNFDTEYEMAVEDLSKRVKSEGISREKIAQYFKSKGKVT